MVQKGDIEAGHLKRIRHLMGEKRGLGQPWPQRAVAELAGVSLDTWKSVESGRCGMHSGRLYDLLLVEGIELDEVKDHVARLTA